MALIRRKIRFTSGRVAVPAVTADQMREVDRIAMQETGPNLFQMMENAGRNLASVSIDLLEPIR
jgi:NAD(P)H-hydrate epimerase